MTGSALSLGAHLPVLPVLAPLLAAPVAVLLGTARGAWWLAFAVSIVSTVLCQALLSTVLADGALHYTLGGWAAPWGIEYRIDAASALVMLLIASMNLVLLVFARVSIEREIEPGRQYLLYTAWLLAMSGLMGMTATADAFNVFVFLEISSLATYTLVALGRDRRALSAAFRYLVMGTVGGTFFLIGVGLLYAATGTLNMADLGQRLPALADSNVVRAAFAFITIGLGLKMAMFPLHGWLPNAYAYAPSAVSALLAATATKVAVYVWIRFVFTIFGTDLVFESFDAGGLLAAIAAAAIVFGTLAAILQHDVKLILAFSSVAQLGYMALGISFVNVAGVTSALVHVFNHALMKAALFAAVGCLVYRLGSSRTGALAGVGWTMPWTSAAFCLAGLSLIGVPGTAGFISKWYLLNAAFDSGYSLLAVLVVITSFLAMIYIGRIIEQMYFARPIEGGLVERAREAPAAMLAATWILVIANLYFGIQTDLTAGVAEIAAHELLGDAL